jgi:hypothetical protein
MTANGGFTERTGYGMGRLPEEANGHHGAILRRCESVKKQTVWLFLKERSVEGG